MLRRMGLVTLEPRARSAIGPRLSRILLVIFSALILMAFLALVGLALWQKYTQTIGESRRTTQNLSRTIEEHALRSFHEADVMLSGLADLFEEQARHGQRDLGQMRSALKAHVLLSRQYRNLAVIDATGHRLTSAAGVMEPLDVSDRDYFAGLRDHPEIDFFISEPFVSRIAKTWSLAFSRRLHRPDGGFDGIVVAVVDLNWLQDFYAALDVGRLGTVTLWDGTASHVLARHPADPAVLGQSFDGGPLFELIGDGERAGTFQSVSPVDGAARIVSFRRVADLPFVVSVALAEPEVLANWHRDLWTYGDGAAIASAVLMLLTAALLRQLRRQHEFVLALRASEAATAEANRRLQASEARFRDYAETASDWYWETDTEHRFSYISDRIRQFGIDPAARIGARRIDNALDAADAKKWRAHEADIARHAPFSDFIYLFTAHEAPRYCSVSGKPLFDEAGRFVGYRGSGRDVTEAIRSERRLRDALVTAETANRAKSEFLAGMSHELRTPLNAIIGFSDLVRSGIAGAMAPKVMEYVEDIHYSGQHLLKMINDILEISRIEAGALTLNEAAVDVGEAVAACVRLLAPRANEGGLVLDVAIEDGMPALFIDETRLKQILLNLLSNAVKFTPAGGRVTVQAMVIESGAMRVAVIDNGIGMTAEEVELAMQPFRQVNSNLARRSEGTGLGLPLTKAFVELHGGRLIVESTPGDGTTASIVFPRERVLQKAA
jgi:PAS domain S-box-containing protein